MLNTKKLVEYCLVIATLTLYLFLPFFNSVPAKALKCLSTDQCEAAASRCRNNGSTWEWVNELEGNCTASSPINSTPTTPTPPSPTGDNIVVEGAGDNIFGLLQTIVNLLYAVIAFVIIGVIITAGIQYSASGGNPQAAGEAKKKINSAIMALIVLALLYPFLQFIVLGRAFNN